MIYFIGVVSLCVIISVLIVGIIDLFWWFNTLPDRDEFNTLWNKVVKLEDKASHSGNEPTKITGLADPSADCVTKAYVDYSGPLPPATSAAIWPKEGESIPVIRYHPTITANGPGALVRNSSHLICTADVCTHHYISNAIAGDTYSYKYDNDVKSTVIVPVNGDYRLMIGKRKLHLYKDTVELKDAQFISDHRPLSEKRKRSKK